MHSFTSSLSFLLFLFLLPLLHPTSSSGRPAVTLVFAHSADTDTNLNSRVHQHLTPRSVNYQEVDRTSQANVVGDAAEGAGGGTVHTPQSVIRKILTVPGGPPVSAAHHGSSNANPQLRRKHIALSRIVSNSTEGEARPLSLYPGKRAAGAQFTNYVTGLGACGTVNKASDFVVALNKEQWDNGAHCYATITITINGQSVQAQIVDECEKCGFNNLDLTDGLFGVWANIVDGTLEGEWQYGSGAPPPPPPPPKTTSAPPPKPTTSKISTTTFHSTKTSSISTSTIAVSSSTSVSSTVSSTANATSTGLPAEPSQSQGTLELLYLASLGISGVLLSSLN